MRGGLIMGGSAYVLWGLSALYWPLLDTASTTEILAQRVVWSAVLLVILIAGTRRWDEIRTILRQPRVVGMLTLASLLTAVNWGAFIYATTHGRVIEASMGYFIAPLVMVVLGVQAFRERPDKAQWLAVALGAAGVVVLIAAYGEPPWFALILAGTFGIYGLVKKRTGVGAIEGMAVETIVLMPAALIVIIVTQVTGRATFGHESWAHTALMIGASFVMLAPMLLFSAAGNLIPLSSLGLMQYIEPTVQFLIGFLVFSESMPASRWAAFALVWAAVLVILVDSVRGHVSRRVAGKLSDEGVLPW